MPTQPIEIQYGQGMQNLEALLCNIAWHGAFCTHGRESAAMPKLEINGLGRLSFPVPATQAQELVALARLAPYGRGKETILDTAVRKVWQIAPSAVKISRKGWDASFQRLLARVTEGLGCEKMAVEAELYKFLIYDQGGFFLPHRDTEKSPGMFGTLVVSLPCSHAGGDLLVRHEGREERVSLVCEEPSEIAWAAFYADCEHEVKPVTSGHRVCLIYNLLHVPAAAAAKGRKKPATSPVPEAPAVSATAKVTAPLLTAAFAGEDPPRKLVWLLEHQYSPAELAFSTLKGADAGRAAVLLEAAKLADCEVHLGIVHIEESGEARPNRSRFYQWDDDDDHGDEDGDYEVAEVGRKRLYIDNWRQPDGGASDFSPLPLWKGELLPAGALDQEAPDSSKLMEATGNEGATYERSYHRAALALWLREESGWVRLQAGAEAVVPYLQKLVAALAPGVEPGSEEVRMLADVMTEFWPLKPAHSRPAPEEPNPQARAARQTMLVCLHGLDRKVPGASLLSSFILRVLVETYDGSENAALAAILPELSQTEALAALLPLFSAVEGVRLESLIQLLGLISEISTCDYADLLVPLLAALAKLPAPVNPHVRVPQVWTGCGGGAREAKPAPHPEKTAVQLLLATRLFPRKAVETLVDAMVAQETVFEPQLVLTPSLVELSRHPAADTPVLRAALERLWGLTASALLGRQTKPPPPPGDWSMGVTLSCKCPDCKALQRFCNDPKLQTKRFPMASSSSSAHFHKTIVTGQLELSRDTQLRGPDQTIICIKTRESHNLLIARHAADRHAMKSLAGLPLGAESVRKRLLV